MPLAELQLSLLNPRKHFDPVALTELATSVRELGIIEPLVARPVADHYEIVAGARRYKAANLAELSTVPVMVKPLTDAQALEIMVVENNQRENVNALEEADGFSRLAQAGYDLDRLAERLGRSKKYVYDRIKLLDLVAPAKQLVSDGLLTAGHAILLARLKPEDQARAIDVEEDAAFTSEGGLSDEDETAATTAADERFERMVESGKRGKPLVSEFNPRDYVGVKPKSVRELNHWIAENVRFRPQEAAAAAPLEFGEVAERVEERLREPGRGKKVIAITFGHYIQPEARDEKERTFGPRSFKFADGKLHRNYGEYGSKPKIALVCPHAVLGVVAVGEQYGQAFDVCIARDKCEVHWKQAITERAKNQKLRDTGKSERADKNEARAQAKEEARRAEAQQAERRRDQVEARVLDQVVANTTELTPDILRALAVYMLNGDMDVPAFESRFKVKWKWNGGAGLLKGLSGRALVQAVAFALASSLSTTGDLDDIADVFGVKVAAIEAAVIKEEKTAAAAKAPVQTSAKPTATKKKR